MRELEILPTGEVRHLDRYVGRVEWTWPLADADGVGVWVREQEPQSKSCSGHEAVKAELLAALKDSEALLADRVQRAIEILES